MKEVALQAEVQVQRFAVAGLGRHAGIGPAEGGLSLAIAGGGSVADVVEQFKAGQLDAVGAPNVAAKFGLGGASNPPQDPSMPPPVPGF